MRMAPLQVVVADALRATSGSAAGVGTANGGPARGHCHHGAGVAPRGWGAPPEQCGYRAVAVDV